MNPPPGTLKCVITASTGGAVMNECLKNPFFKSLIHSVLCDQPCGAAEKARSHGVAVKTIAETDPDRFCEQLLAYVQENGIDYIFSFYTKFYSDHIRQPMPDRIINLHPTLLPAFKGNDAWEYVKAYGVRFVGSTVEFIHERMDEGRIILQTVCPWDANLPADHIRHRVFVQQCKSLLQASRWLAEGRITTSGCRVHVQGARYEFSEFSPNLDFQDAIQFNRPFSLEQERLIPTT
jgi:phosphoribosylglycinamide formyltransferase 1